MIVANLPYLSPGDTRLRRRAPGRRLLVRGRARALPPLDRRRGRPSRPPDGGVLIQFDGEVLEAERSELPWLLGGSSRSGAPPPSRGAPPTDGSAILLLRYANGDTHRGRNPLRRRHGRRAARIGRNHHAISDRVGGRGGHAGRRPPSRSLGRRALPPSPTRIRTSCSHPAPRAGARSTTPSRRSTPGCEEPSAEWKVRYALHARPRARALREAAAPRLRHRAAPPPGRRARRDAHRADRRRPEDGENGNGNGRRDAAEEDDEPEDELELAPEPTPTRTIDGAAAGRARIPARSAATASATRPRRARRSPPPGFVEAARTEGVLILTHRRLLVDQFRRELTEHGYGIALHRRDPRRAHRAAAVEPDHDPDVRVVRAPRRRDRARRVPARDLRRGAHRARREDLGRDPLV